ncbi:hypothetical protein [Acidiferrobacter sp.]|uniref:hypothetical protein n=1 Tax=Acidiferrobacter sp. TaxID=1872107 RepID=UPI00261EA4D7|nr:hypothetical protein [Acidiferrobacter sp.]
MKRWMGLLLCAAAPSAFAIMQLPGYAQGSDLRMTIEERAHAITDVIALVVSILAIIGILIGAGYFAIGQGDRGRSYVVGSVIGLILAASAYGIAALVVGS